MRLIDLYYKAITEYRKLTALNNEAVKVRRIVKHANFKDDLLKITKFEVDIEEDWIKNIKEGLVFVQKAINEERQFIRTEGEVVRIEKVKKTSKASLEHLSKHSNLITRVPEEGKNIVPDKLFIVEKLNDYAVYENRFLYFLLDFLRVFIYTNLEKIKSRITTYNAEMIVHKSIELASRQVTFNLDFHDIYYDEPFLVQAMKTNNLITELDMLYATVEALMATNLMREVSKSPMINPPITKTNVLRMNPNFRAALALYDYISSYTKQTFTFREVIKTFNPFDNDMADNFAEAIEFTSFLTYFYGADIKEDVDAVYLYEEQKAKDLVLKKQKEELARLKKRIKERNISHEEYILLLEKQNHELEDIVSKTDLLNNQISELRSELTLVKANNEAIKAVSKNLELKQEELKAEIDTLNVNYYRDMTALEQSHEVILLELRAELEEEHKEHISQIEAQYAVEIVKFEAQISSLNTRITELEDAQVIRNSENEQALVQMQEKLKEESEKQQNEIREMEKIVEEERGARYNAQGELIAIRQGKGGLTDNLAYTTEAEFKELEQVMKHFNKFFKERWKAARKEIRKEIKAQAEAEVKAELQTKKEMKKERGKKA